MELEDANIFRKKKDGWLSPFTRQTDYSMVPLGFLCSTLKQPQGGAKGGKRKNKKSVIRVYLCYTYGVTVPSSYMMKTCLDTLAAPRSDQVPAEVI